MFRLNQTVAAMTRPSRAIPTRNQHRPPAHHSVMSVHHRHPARYRLSRATTPPGVGYHRLVSDYEKAVTTRLKTARGHLDGVIRMVEQEAYCPDVMKQLAAV
jgi:hypothetical protein